MDKDSLSFVLAAWGAILSTLLAIPKVIEFLYTIKRKLAIFAYSEPPFDVLKIAVTNASHRPVTITEVIVLYGIHPSQAREVTRRSDQLPKKLEEGDLWTISIPQKELVSDARKNGIEQLYNHRLWVAFATSTGKRFHRVVNIDPSIITKPYEPIAVHYIASALFLGFPQWPSEIRIFFFRR